MDWAASTAPTPLRDHRHGRIYRIIYTDGKPSRTYDLSKASPAELVEVLKSDNLLWRLHAQRLLVEKRDRSVISALIPLASDRTVDAIGLNPGAIHALWTIHGLGGFDGASPDALAAAAKALTHPSAAVRKAALEVLPRNESSVALVLDGGLLEDKDAQVRKAALLSLAELPQSDRAGSAIYQTLANKRDEDDRWINDATSIAACRHDAGFLKALFAAHPGAAAPGAPVAQITPDNLIPNPCFADIDSHGMPNAWKVRSYVGKAEYSIDSPGRAGDHCLKIQSAEGSDTSLFVDVPVEPFTTYTLSAYIKTRDLKGATGAMLNAHGTEHRTPPVTGTADWTKVEVTFNSGDAVKLSINCLFGGWGKSTGAAWFDDVQLVRVQPSGMPGREGRVAGVVISEYARRGPVDTVVATLSAARKSDPLLASMILKGLSAGWPDACAPRLSPADIDELHQVMASLPEGATDRLLALAGRWDRRDLFPEQSAAVVAKLRGELADVKLAPSRRADAARRLVAALDEPATVELLFKQISPASTPEVQLGILEALGDSHTGDVGSSLVAQWATLTPTAQRAALNLMLRRSAWTGALLDGVEHGKINSKDVLPEQWEVLNSLPDAALADRARKLRKHAGGAVSADRAEIVKKLIHLADQGGDAVKGKVVFEKNCQVCHQLGNVGGKVGPDLTGIGLRPKSDILLQVLDPNRTVEGTYRQWIVKTRDDVIAGRIYSESRTNIEIMDAAGLLHHIMRDDILLLKPTEKGIMPEGLEAIPGQDLSDLLEYLSQSKVKR